MSTTVQPPKNSESLSTSRVADITTTFKAFLLLGGFFCWNSFFSKPNKMSWKKESPYLRKSTLWNTNAHWNTWGGVDFIPELLVNGTKLSNVLWGHKCFKRFFPSCKYSGCSLKLSNKMLSRLKETQVFFHSSVTSSWINTAKIPCFSFLILPSVAKRQLFLKQCQYFLLVVPPQENGTSLCLCCTQRWSLSSVITQKIKKCKKLK